MVSIATIVCILITLLVTLVLPVAVLIVFSVKWKNRGIASAWLLGAAGFFVTQILIRVPILTVLQTQTWFMEAVNKHMILYAFGLAFTAGLFELAGRFAVAKLMQKNLTFHRSLAAGLGHGGIEAILLVGMTYVNNLLYIFLINTGTFDILLSQTAAMGVDISQLELIREQFLTTSPAIFLLGGFERILAMTAHTAMSLLVCYGVAHKKALPCALTCLGIHTFIDLTAGISLLATPQGGNALSQTSVYLIIYAILIAVAAASLWTILTVRRRWTEKEVTYDSEE